MHIVYYPHPTLRHKSKPVKRVDAALKKTVREMFELMYEAKGVGLAANQVDLPLRLFVMNTEAKPNAGEELVFINPVISKPKGLEEVEEGCLSLPELYGDVKRPEQIKLNAFNLSGEEIEAELNGFFARVVQHETDHLDGVMFIDRMNETERLRIQSELDEFARDFELQRKQGRIPDDEQIARRLAEIEATYC